MPLNNFKLHTFKFFLLGLFPIFMLQSSYATTAKEIDVSVDVAWKSFIKRFLATKISPKKPKRFWFPHRLLRRESVSEQSMGKVQ